MQSQPQLHIDVSPQKTMPGVDTSEPLKIPRYTFQSALKALYLPEDTLQRDFSNLIQTDQSMLPKLKKLQGTDNPRLTDNMCVKVYLIVVTNELKHLQNLQEHPTKRAE